MLAQARILCTDCQPAENCALRWSACHSQYEAAGKLESKLRLNVQCNNIVSFSLAQASFEGKMACNLTDRPVQEIERREQRSQQKWHTGALACCGRPKHKIPNTKLITEVLVSSVEIGATRNHFFRNDQVSRITSARDFNRHAM